MEWKPIETAPSQEGTVESLAHPEKWHGGAGGVWKQCGGSCVMNGVPTHPLDADTGAANRFGL